MNDKDSYSVEVREPTCGGDDYTEEYYECDTPEEVKEVIAEMHEDENLHSVLFYRAGTNGNPKDVTKRFLK